MDPEGFAEIFTLGCKTFAMVALLLRLYFIVKGNEYMEKACWELFVVAALIALWA